jgi:hypothetical protein
MSNGYGVMSLRVRTAITSIALRPGLLSYKLMVSSIFSVLPPDPPEPERLRMVSKMKLETLVS